MFNRQRADDKEPSYDDDDAPMIQAGSSDDADPLIVGPTSQREVKKTGRPSLVAVLVKNFIPLLSVVR